MAEREPELFKTWTAYMRQRQVMASAVLFKTHGWYEWEQGHAKLFGILLWHYQTKKTKRFKYSKLLKRQGYRRTHNYRLLKSLVEKSLLQRQGNGYYSICTADVQVIDNALAIIKELDGLVKVREKGEVKG